jgi:hypothetical protein
MRIASIIWNPNSDVTVITFSDEFLNSDVICHADVLQDSISILSDVYDNVFVKDNKIEKINKL